MINFEAELTAYAEAVKSFRAEYDLPAEWFAGPDHVAIKCAGSSDYEATLALWLPKAAQAQYVELNGRRLASARLLEPITVGGLGRADWLEVMEPRPEKVGIDPVGVDHMEFVFTDFAAAERVLRAKGIPYEAQQNPGHEWLSILADGHEFKLTNKSLADVIAAEFASGAAKALK